MTVICKSTYESARNANHAELVKQYRRTMNLGFTCTPRGQRIMELLNETLTVSPIAPFNQLPGRNYRLDYFKEEMTWKLGANKFDDSIKKHAKMWESVQNPDRTFNSNYGVYWFGPQNGLMTALGALIRDKDSRQAIIPMLSSEHLTPQTIDTVCTEAVGFYIRDSVLYMFVHMRSSDQVFGLGTDIPTFAFLYRLAFGILRDYYDDLTIGSISITAMSSHIYERHFDMVSKMGSEFESVDGAINLDYNMPWCDATEALYLVHSRGKKLSRGGELGQWLTARGEK